MEIAILADVHANLPAFRAVLADAEGQGCKRVYHAGDLITIGPHPAEVIDLARSYGVRCVQGNHEGWIERGLPLDPIRAMSDEELMHQHWTHSRLDKLRKDFIRALPHTICETLEGVRVLIVHFALGEDAKSFKNVNLNGTDEEILDLFGKVDADLVCFGHLHGRRFNQAHSGAYFLNPGSVGCTHDGLADYAVIDVFHGAFQIAQRRVPYERQALLARYDELEIPDRRFIRKVFFGVTVDEPPLAADGAARD
jgi:putative phosphoesterase